jgi:anti-sigma regulatory factor (Ser/Thr protein kinase)
MSEQLELTIGSELKNLERIAEFVTGAAEHFGLGPQQSFEVQMATDEACTNIIEHAYGPDQPGEISICCETAGDDFVVTLRDRGRTFDPTKVPDPDLTCSLEDRKIGGLGLFFMRKLMDRVVFHSDPRTGNELKMFKRRVP